MAPLATAGADSVEIGGVVVEFEDHVAGLITYGAIGVRSTVIEDLLAGSFGCVCCRGLGRREFAEGSEKGWVDSTTLKEESANDLLEPFDLVWR